MLISQVFTHIPLTGCVLWALPLCIFRLFFIFALQPKTVQHTLDDLGYLGLWLLSKSLFSYLSFLQVCLKRVLSLPSCDTLWAVVQNLTPHYIGLVTTQMLELLCISVFIQLCPLSCVLCTDLSRVLKQLFILYTALSFINLCSKYDLSCICIQVFPYTAMSCIQISPMSSIQSYPVYVLLCICLCYIQLCRHIYNSFHATTDGFSFCQAQSKLQQAGLILHYSHLIQPLNQPATLYPLQCVV